MTPYPVPAGESERIEVVRSLLLLDTPPEERFDRISRVAAAVFGVPVALVTLIDTDRQWLKACVGTIDREFPRSESFCATTILSSEPLVVPDLRADSRFDAFPTVAGPPYLRFYAGHPLRVQGQPVGTLCLLDTAPRALTEDELDRLVDLAHWAEDEMGAVELAAAVQHERETAHALQALQQRDELILTAAQTGVLGTDPAGRITFVNPAAAAMLAAPAADLVGLDLHEALHGEAHPAASCPVRRALQDRVPQRVPVEPLVRRDGVRIEVEYAAAPLLVDSELTGTVVTMDDVTAQRAVDRLKDEFVSVVSHELRTPLTSIRGSLGLLASGRFGELPAGAARLVGIAESNSDRLVRLVNDILDLERIESGATGVDLVVQPVRPLLQAAHDAVIGAAEAAGVRVEVRGGDGEVAADADLLVQALVNLLGNAVKFSPAGSCVDLEGSATDGEVRLVVRDRGRGIPADKLTGIFNRFEQVDASDARDKGGSGLGLSITRSIAQRLGGRVTVESTLGEGSAFTLVLPTAQEPGKRVVLVEDDPAVAQLLTSALRARGLEVLTAAGEDEAVETVRRVRPDLVLLDVELAQGSGYGVAARLREDPALAGTRCVVATAHELDDAGRARLQVGTTTFVRKGAADGLVAALMTAVEP